MDLLVGALVVFALTIAIVDINITERVKKEKRF